MGILDKNNLTSLPDSSFEYRKSQQETLSDLRNDDEFVKRTERFLESVGEGDSIADMYQYFRGADWNLSDTGKVARQAKDFNKEQLEDYNYLRTRFDNVNVGGFREKAQLGVDVTQELLSDPINWASAVLIPWSGGTSLAARAAGGAAAKKALQEATKLGIRKSLGKVVLNTPGQVLKGPLTTKQILGVASAEGMVYGGTHNYVQQSIDLNTGRRDERSLKETALAAGIGGVAAPAVLAGLKGVGKIPKWVNTVNEQRIARIDHNENYKSTFFERTVGKTIEGLKTTSEVLKLTALPLRPTTFLRKKAKKNELFQNLLKLIKYDAMEGFKAPKIGKQEVLKKDYNMELRQLWGNLDDKITKILGEKGFNLYSFQNRFTSQYKRNWGFNPGLSDDVNFDLAYVIRSGKNNRLVNGKEVKIETNIVKAGYAVRRLLNNIYDKAVKAGLKPNRSANYFPRGWRIDIIRANKEEFITKIMKAEQTTRKAAEDLWKRLATDGTPESSTTSGLSSRLKSERLLTKLDDAEFGKFLNNDVEGVLRQYIAESSALITRTKLLGETTEDFVKRWINPIKKSGLNLEKKEELYLKVLYEVVTGQRGRINKSRRDFFDLIPTGKIGAGIHDTLTVTMQMSMLGLSTLTSFAEIGVPLLLGNEARVGMKAVKRGILDTGEEWWKRNKQLFGVGDPNVDIRAANRQDLNAFMTSVNLAGEDRAIAIYGQAVGKTATKLQNFFFKAIGLHDWTRFVQLVGYDMGKNLIYKNLRTIADEKAISKSWSRRNKRKAIDIKRMEDELAELGINVQNGLNWLDRGALHTDRFFMQDVRAAANRYTDEVVMNPTAASAQKPLVHSLATTKWIYGLMGFPTAFANGPLRRVIRNVTKDAETIVAGGRRLSTARAATGALFMVNIGLLNYTLRTGGKNWEDLKTGKITEAEMLERSLMYAGLLGPAEIYVRYTKAKKYESWIMSTIGSVTGPNLTDLIDYITDFTKNGTLAETALKRAPFMMSIKSLYPETYKEWQKAARELDKNMGLGPSGVEKEKGEVIAFFKGGEVSKENPVPNAAAEPSERVNPYTGKPYEAEMERLGFGIGGFTGGFLKVLGKEALKKGAKKATITDSRKVQKGIMDEILKDEILNLGPEKRAATRSQLKETKPKKLPKASETKLGKSAENLAKGKISYDDFRKVAQEDMQLYSGPVIKIPELPTLEEVVSVLKPNQRKAGISELNKTFKTGEKVSLRLDIPAYQRFNTWIMSIHKPNAKKILGYGRAAKIKNVKFFNKDPGASLYTAVGGGKTPSAAMDGFWVKQSEKSVRDEAVQIIKGGKTTKYTEKQFKNNEVDGWVQVNYNPRRASFFSDKKFGLAIESADEVIQVGNVVLAKNPKIGKPTEISLTKTIARALNSKFKTDQFTEGQRITFKSGGTARNYRQEYDRYQSKPDQLLNRAARNAARNKLKQEGRVAKGDGKDVDHKDGNPRNNSPSNLNVKKKENNRSFSRRVAARNGGLMVSIGVTPVSEKQISKLTKSLKKRKAKNEGGAEKIELTHDQKQYIAFYNMAVKAGNAFPEIVASQASLESSHGTSDLTTKYNNPFGIKVLREAEVNAGQPSVRMKTREVIDGKEIVSEESFRVYDNIENSFVGYKEKVAHPRYDSIRKATNKEEYAQALQDSGYASDPEYAKLLVGITDRYAPLIK